MKKIDKLWFSKEIIYKLEKLTLNVMMKRQASRRYQVINLQILTFGFQLKEVIISSIQKESKLCL